MRRRSVKREKQEREYSKRRKAFLLLHPHCEAALHCCSGSSQTVHHRRGRIGNLLLDERYWTVCCLECHVWIETNPAEAKELGLSESRLSNDTQL